MNILVTGGAGFIGSNIADAYLAAGHEVYIVDNFSTGDIANVPKDAKLYEMDIRDEKFGDVLRENKIDVINHHAAQIDVRRSVDDPKNDLSINVLGTLNILEASVRAGVKRFIFASTGGAIYGEQEYFPADELHPTAPMSPYGITKLCVEKYLHYYHLVKKLEYTVFRYTNVFGPRQSPHGEAGVVAIFCHKFLRGENPVINGDGLQTRDFVYVEDVVRANVLALTMRDTDTLNVCTQRETDINEIFKILNRAYGERAVETHAPAKEGEQQRSVCSFKKIQTRLDWTPKISIEEGLKRTADFFQRRYSGEKK